MAIIGAGPAGSAAAISLARAGRSVLLIEQRQFPRGKVCGGCLSGPATSRLKRLLGDRKPPGVTGSKITFVFEQQRVTCRPKSATWLALRAELDMCLVEEAMAAGATVRFGEAADLEPGTSGWEMVVGKDRIRPRTILVATGASAFPRALGIRGRRSGLPMVGQQWIQPVDSSLTSPGCAELHWLRGGYIGLATIDAHRCIVALAAQAETAAGRNAFRELRGRNPGASIWNRLAFDAPQRYHAKGAGGFPWVPHRLGVENVLLIGDAAGFVEPFTGEGIGQALLSAECAARAILEGDHIVKRYSAMMLTHRMRLWRTRILGSLLSAAPVRRLLQDSPNANRGDQMDESSRGLKPAAQNTVFKGVFKRMLAWSVEAVHVGGTR